MNKRLGSRWRPDFWFFTKVFVILAMCMFIVYPFYTILTKSVFSNKVDGITLYNFKRFFSKPYYYQALIRSMVVCFATVLTTTIVELSGEIFYLNFFFRHVYPPYQGCRQPYRAFRV